MKVFVDKCEKVGKMQTWLISTETSDGRCWFGETVEEVIRNFENEYGVNVTSVYERVDDKYVERKW